jgi:hypothetical protein
MGAKTIKLDFWNVMIPGKHDIAKIEMDGFVKRDYWKMYKDFGWEIGYTNLDKLWRSRRNANMFCYSSEERTYYDAWAMAKRRAEWREKEMTRPRSEEASYYGSEDEFEDAW